MVTVVDAATALVLTVNVAAGGSGRNDNTGRHAGCPRVAAGERDLLRHLWELVR